ncbi:hypothetical protein [Duganella violaceipulchra]|uniref:YopN family type III secretion system gatekeeper subunit n=1 Tax=Duganella violaceipulchra TaxID=2849652 RepID=A0AA41H5Z6_9BURK|nr:hypothetical protein [Duganella violaceicalia]MBV6322447.1 hypothetical protein [Duganella violaceicalia]MCP2010652.1 hypothetical protein [Duganella violaceicalia]
MFAPLSNHSKDLLQSDYPSAAAAPRDGLLQEGLTNAAEELTFQFSELVEARDRTLEERFSAGDELHEESQISIHQVRAVLRLMEGRDGYDRLRGQARVFAQAFREGEAGVMELLSPKFFAPHERYALLRLAADVLDQDSAASGRLADDARALVDRHHDQMGGLFATLPALKQARAVTAGQPGEAAKQFLQLLAATPTVRSVLDVLAETAGEDGAGPVLNTMQQTLGGQIGLLEQIGVFVTVSRLVGAVRTMLAYGGELAAYPAAPAVGSNCAMSFKHTRALIDIANSSVPGGLLDKLAVTVLGRSAPAARWRLFSVLHRQARRWPNEVWASLDARALVLQQLVRKQQA